MGPHDLQLIPARTLNEHVYCPWLEWTKRQFRHNADTAQGEHVQRRVDEERGRTPSADDIDLDAVARELTLRGFPRPEDVELSPGAWMRFATTRPGTSRRGAPTVVGVRLRFADPVSGPIALGGLSHFGLGLFSPEGR